MLGSANRNTPSVFQVSGNVASEPEVIRCLRLALTGAVKDTVQQIVSVTSSRRSRETNLSKPHIPDHLLETIPQEWNYIPKENKRNESNRGKCICSSLRNQPTKKYFLSFFPSSDRTGV